MTKNVSHISTRIVCPKCGTKSLRKSLHFSNLGEEYFCDKDHVYFGIAELVNIWDYDISDFYSEIGTQLTEIEWLKVVTLEEFKEDAKKNNGQDVGATLDPEGEWSSKIARDESYEVVNRILMGVEEWEGYFDPRDLPCPILQVGGC